MNEVQNELEINSTVGKWFLHSAMPWHVIYVRTYNELQALQETTDDMRNVWWIITITLTFDLSGFGWLMARPNKREADKGKKCRFGMCVSYCICFAVPILLSVVVSIPIH